MQYPEMDVEEPDSDCEPDINTEVLEEEQARNIDGGECLYEDASLTVASSNSSSILISKFKSKHKLTNEGLRDLLQLIELHCPKPNKCVTFQKAIGEKFSCTSSLL